MTIPTALSTDPGAGDSCANPAATAPLPVHEVIDARPLGPLQRRAIGKVRA